ncbi:MAG: hypothetical protein V1495_00515 [Pseudomonadota bacterium]
MKRATAILILILMAGLFGCGSTKDKAEQGLTTAPVVLPYTAPVDRVVTLGCDQLCFNQCGAAPSVGSATPEAIHTYQFCNNDCVSDCLNRNGRM